MDNSTSQVPFFSVIIPTRNRPILFKRALESAINQTFDNIEIIIVNDGSDDKSMKMYKEIESGCQANVRFYNLIHRPKGHGSSYSRNYGAQVSNGQYLCFLDDDDLWIDNEHLSTAHESIKSHTEIVDAYYTNQKAYDPNGQESSNCIWLEDLISRFEDTKQDNLGNTVLDVTHLTKSNGFSHLNCSIIRKEFFEKIGGMDEDIRYESDRDLYLRTIDLAQGIILFSPRFIARHNIPNAKKKDNVSTASSDIERFIYQLRMYNKGLIFSKTSNVRDVCIRNKMYILKKMTEELYRNKDYEKSASFSRQALGVRFSLKWFLFSLYLSGLTLIYKVKSPTSE
ncbi:glycosyltransferase [Vibrio sp. PNB22_1_1]